MSKVTTNDLNFPYKIERKGIYLDRRWWDQNRQLKKIRGLGSTIIGHRKKADQEQRKD